MKTITTRPTPIPRYRKVREYVVSHIQSGAWQSGDPVPSENTLVKRLGVSRMTVNRALRELTHEGLLLRVQGTGTFVAEKRPPADLLELRNIADDIRESGRRHSARLELLRSEKANDAVAQALGLPPGGKVFHSVIVHMADGQPIQIEDRFVNPSAVPDYLSIDFRSVTPNEHLTKMAPPTEVEHIVEAVMPEPRVRKLLRIPADEPCLQLRRRTWSGARVVAAARLIYPGRTHCFGTRFAFRADGKTTRSFI
jgi:GntR family histidine utilization transcriptional repressor